MRVFSSASSCTSSSANFTFLCLFCEDRCCNAFASAGWFFSHCLVAPICLWALQRSWWAFWILSGLNSTPQCEQFRSGRGRACAQYLASTWPVTLFRTSWTSSFPPHVGQHLFSH